jgi:predicted nucleotide-binding protein (sugar kinase/HSP70/actin superfamily)
MKVGIPKGLMYCRYHPFLVTFFSELGARIIVSEDTNKNIFDTGIKTCVDDACLPVKVFHGHVDSIKDKCDVLVIPRIMQLQKNEYICPKFCGLPEMVLNSLDDLPAAITEPIYATSWKNLYSWAKTAGKFLGKSNNQIKRAFISALNEQKKHKTGIADTGYEINIALTGHPYNIYDSFLNMNLVKKINSLGMGIMTAEFTEEGILYNNDKICKYGRDISFILLSRRVLQTSRLSKSYIKASKELIMGIPFLFISLKKSIPLK